MEMTKIPGMKQLSLAELINITDHLKKNGEIKSAIDAYTDWLSRIDSPNRHVAMFNLGVLLTESGRDSEAANYYEDAININPKFYQARINRGLLYERAKDNTNAIKQWVRIFEEKDDDVEWKANACIALNHAGRLLESQKLYNQAEKYLLKSIELNPKQSDAIQHWLHLRQKQCSWPLFESGGILTPNQIISSASPLATLALTDDTAIQWLTATNFVNRKFNVEVGSLWNGPLVKRSKFRIGYVSGDLCTHAVGLLLPNLLEKHNKDTFEIFAFDYSPEDGSETRSRIKEACDYFIDIRNMSDQDAAILIRRCDIDILVDMHGLSSGARPGIFALRPAGIQVAYLGYLGTTAMPWLDYVVTDKFCMTTDNIQHFTEQPIFVEGSVVPLLDASPINAIKKNRTEYGLPDDGIILGCFNNIYKITPEILSIWAEILNKNEAAILWLLNDNKWATSNLKMQLKKHGISDSRIFFSNRCPHQEYKVRLAVIDIYLDTFPYNAGSTAWDVLDAGVPLVTLSGRSMMSRIAGSMLSEAGLPELITADKKSYIKKITDLLDSNKRKKLVDKIQKKRKYWHLSSKKLIHSLEENLIKEFNHKLNEKT